MFTVCTWKEIEEFERKVENKEIVVFLFVRPTCSGATEIIRDFDYLHLNAASYCSVYAIGYSDKEPCMPDFRFQKADTTFAKTWYFSMEAFTGFKNRLEERISWKYSGENEVLILQNNPGKPNVLNFSNYVSINVNKGIRDGYLDSFAGFMEALVRNARKHVTAADAIDGVVSERISIKSVMMHTITDCKAVPTSVQKIIKDRLFYRSARHTGSF
ncbi:MAG: hypothetical protein HUJ58_03110 [Erysipelotrichaceae bacterium]|nr:hypothetical protein [Erysipelotrichaceae bacterium]